jgi:DeoR family transcriptional regulator of aga operon
MAPTAENSGSPEQGLLLIDERRQHILSLIQSQGRVLVGELSRNLNISQITIRKDLEYLQSKGLVQRTHGGALRIQSSALLDPTLKQKQKHHSQEKQRIAAAAARMVEEGQCVMLDSGTTTTAVAHELKRFSQLTVITNAVNIAADLTRKYMRIFFSSASTVSILKSASPPPIFSSLASTARW